MVATPIRMPSRGRKSRVGVAGVARRAGGTVVTLRRKRQGTDAGRTTARLRPPHQEGSSLACVRSTKEGRTSQITPPQDPPPRSRLIIGQNGPSDSALAASSSGRLRRSAAERPPARCASRVSRARAAPLGALCPQGISTDYGRSGERLPMSQEIRGRSLPWQFPGSPFETIQKERYQMTRARAAIHPDRR
jgi:hypothetical protein